MHADGVRGVGERAVDFTGMYSKPIDASKGGVAIRKTGDEHYVLLPTYQGQTTLAPVDYYLAVISEGGTNVGANPPNSRIGTNGAGYTLLSRGNVQTTNLGKLADIDLMQHDSLEAG